MEGLEFILIDFILIYWTHVLIEYMHIYINI